METFYMPTKPKDKISTFSSSIEGIIKIKYRF